jgi:hypothetical protein
LPDFFFLAKINQIGLGWLANLARSFFFWLKINLLIKSDLTDWLILTKSFFFLVKNQLTNQIRLGQLANFGQIFFSWLKINQIGLGWLAFY